MFKLDSLSLSNPKEMIKESKEYRIEIDSLPPIPLAQQHYTLNVLDSKNDIVATITNHNTQNIINPEILLDDRFSQFADILLQYKQSFGFDRVRLEVEGGTGLMVLEVVRKWEYSPNNEDFKYWATISEFSLKLDDEIVKDSEGKDIKGYIIEPAGYNPKKSRTAEEQQKIAGGDIRIPAGEYEVFWKKSNIDSPALMAENPNNKERYLDDLQKTMKNLNINIEQLYCNIATCKHNKDNRKTFGTKHIHIVPQLKPKNSKNSVIGTSRNGILIHYGDTGEWSTGCLLPTNELKWKKERWIAKDRNSTVNAVAKLYITLIEHDTESFKNYALGTNNPSKSTIKNFIIKIQEKDKIESYPPEKE
ncbi:hypothetical protein [Helicobacter monodelphidis]|uniref:hypothetical protein n=1 Tax=Helicobacter sp. 15-1451 TaxID=2004995 RepID=UPI00215BAC96|nr:hypothetical protein [Helicobacter sp. 15-1451]